MSQPDEPAAPPTDEPPYPASIGILADAPEDLAERIDDYLDEGFSQ
jgi:hypothetical protein